MLLAVPASWLAANAQSFPSAGGVFGVPAAASSQRDGLSGAASAKDRQAGATADKSGRQTGSVQSKQSAAASKPATKTTAKSVATDGVSRSAPSTSSAKPSSLAPGPTAGNSLPNGNHDNVITTIFWAGEAADASNAYITNTMSAWDEKWQEHFGGYDDPDRRNGYYPAGFTPKENPFYFALPYNDYDENGRRRADAGNCSAVTGVTSPHTSWCKNAWIKITKGGKSAYAQWQDVGPMHEDDAGYVFGTAKPKNTWGAKAGLDVSPAVRDYLGLQGIDTTSWTFVHASAVPAGPWKNIVTTSGVYWE